MSVSSKASSEASKKGLTGERKRAYVGGAIHRARQEQADHREAIADARSQIRYHEAQIAGLREGVKLRRAMASEGKPKRSPSAKELEKRILTSDLKPIRHITTGDGVGEAMARGLDRDRLLYIYGQDQLPQALDQYPTTSLRAEAKNLGMSAGGSREALIARLAAPPTPRAAPVTRPLAQSKRAKAAKRELIPVGRVDPAALDPYQPPNPHALRQLYGDEQLREALNRYSLDALKKSAAAHGVDPKASSKRVLVDRLAAKAQGKEQPPKPARAPRPKKPPTLERQIAQAGGYVPKTPADRLRKTPVREMTDAQLLRDWQNNPPERRRGVLEREMARRQAKAEKASKPKAPRRGGLAGALEIQRQQDIADRTLGATPQPFIWHKRRRS